MVAGPAPLRPEALRLPQRHLDVEEKVVPGHRAVVVFAHGREGSTGTYKAHNDILMESGNPRHACGRFARRLSWSELHKLINLIKRLRMIRSEILQTSSLKRNCSQAPLSTGCL